jgi:hypothetical protein
MGAGLSPEAQGAPQGVEVARISVLDLEPVPDHAREGGPGEPVRAGRVVVEADLQRDQALLAEVDALGDPPLLPVLEVKPAALPTCLDVGRLETGGAVLGAAHSLLTITWCRG